MKTITRSKICLPLAAMILTAAFVGPAAAQKQVPFKGTIQGQDTDKGFTSPGMFLVETNGTGIGTLLGQFSFTLKITINVADLTDTGPLISSPPRETPSMRPLPLSCRLN